MGCVITRSTQPHIISTKLKIPVPNKPNYDYHTDSAPGSTQKLVSEHPTSDQQASQNGTPTHESSSQGVLKQLKTLKSINTNPKRLDSFPKLILPSNNASLQDFSFKGQAELSFADKELNTQPSGPLPTMDNNSLRTDLNNLRVTKDFTPCFAKPSSFRSGSPSLNNPNMDSAQQEKESNLWSLGPIKDSHISLAPSAEIGDSRPSFREKTINEEKNNTQPKISVKSPVTVKNSSLILEDKVEVKPQESENTIPTIKVKNINQRFQKILLSDSVATPIAGGNFSNSEVRNSMRMNNFDQRLNEASPPKTLTIFDVPATTDSITKKSLELPDHTIITTSTTNACSIATISNLINMCKDVKKKDFEKKFRTNLVDLIKEKSQSQEHSEQKTQDGPKQTSILIKNGRRFSGTPINKQSSSNILSKSAFSNNLLNMMKDEEIKPHPPAQPARNGSEDVFEDLSVPSPIIRPDGRSLSRYGMSPLPRIAQLNNSILRQSESSMHQEKSINFEEGISRMDWDKYSLCEHIGNVEIDDRSLSQTHLEESIALDAMNNTQLMSSPVGTEILEAKGDTSTNLIKSKSIPYHPSDKADEAEGHAPTKNTPKLNSHKTLNVNDSVSTLQYLSPQQQPRTLVGSQRAKRMMAYARADSQVVETNRVDVSVDDEGQKKINQYILIKEIGKGGFGKVKLSFNVDNKQQYAIKVANKKKLQKKLLTKQKSAFTQLASEIAIMKKLDHPNIVKLHEVIDCPSNDKLYLVMEYVKRGSVMSRGFWRQATKAKGLGNPDDNDGPFFKKKMTLIEQKAKKYFRHLVLGLDFLHNYAEIVHRDIKPENLLISEDDTLKISDFGISQIMQGDDLLENNAGTKYYLAPEAWEGKAFHGKPTDVWAAGGTLYYFLVGKPPFDGINPQDIQTKIKETEPNYPEELNPKAVELIKGCLKKDPNERLTLEQILQDPWLTNDGHEPLTNEAFEHVEVTEEEVGKAFTKLKFMAAIRVMAKLKKTLTISRRNIERRKTTDEVSKKKSGYQSMPRKSEQITINSTDDR